MTSPRTHVIDPHPEKLVNPDLLRLLCGIQVTVDRHTTPFGRQRRYRITLDPARATCKVCLDLGRQLEMF